MKKPKKVLYKAIPLLPTDFTAEILFCPDKEPVTQAMARLYGGSVEYYDTELRGDEVNIIESFGTKHIVCILRSKDPYIIAHEAVHITWYLQSMVGFTFSATSQEIQAYYVGYLVREIQAMLKNAEQHTLTV